jgi:hypothetical protein
MPGTIEKHTESGCKRNKRLSLGNEILDKRDEAQTLYILGTRMRGVKHNNDESWSRVNELFG